MSMPRRLAVLLIPLSLALLPAAAPPGSLLPLRNSEPLTPEKERATFQLPKGFRVELVACEPQVIDPVAMTFDERGRIFVAEMLGYPNDGVGTGKISSGRIKLLTDKDGDGFYETATTWADGLRFPTGLTVWRDGLLVANAPDLIYLRDSKDEGKATSREVLYTGFHTANIQQLLNSLQFAFDNRIHACAGGGGGLISCPQKKNFQPVELRGRGICFDPDVPGSLEPTSGGGQYGLTADDFGRWFTATNSQHLRHIILPDNYLRRNASLPVSAVTLDIPEHGAACKVFRKSPFEAWRVERTTRRASGSDAKRFSPTELVPGGYVTSACSPCVYTADLFPAEYRGSAFVCDPANNLVIRDTLHAKGATYVAKRGHAESEFLTSTDNWFRPTFLTVGPDGALYVLDFYREVIETPISLPDDIKKRVNGQSRARGRIWRITTAKEGTKPPKVNLHEATGVELVKHLESGNPFWRLMAQRLLIQRDDTAGKTITALRQLLKSKSAAARLHATWTLHDLGELKISDVEALLKDEDAGVREQVLRLPDHKYVGESKEAQTLTYALADDPSPRVRFQLAFFLGEPLFSTTPERQAAAAEALAKIARHKATDNWTETAILSSASKSAPALLKAMAKDKDVRLSFLTRLASLVGASGSDADLGEALSLLGEAGKEPTAFQIALLDGLGKGLDLSNRPLAKLWDNPPTGLEASVKQAKALFEKAGVMARDEKRDAESRAAAVGLLGRGPFAPLKDAAPDLLSPRSPPEVQFATVRALGGHVQPEVATLILAAWTQATPALRREMSEVLFARPERITALLTAMEKKTVLAAHLEPSRVERLRKHSNKSIRDRAAKVLTGQVAPERKKVIESYESALDLKADVGRGKAAFKKACATCHKLEDVGVQVGADLLAALRNKTREQLLIDVLDPSREVDSRFLSYEVTTTRGRVYSGIIAAETASSVTLKRGEGAEDVILRNQIDKIVSTGKSLMPEGLEMQLSKQELADLIAYLLRVGGGPSKE